MNQGLENEANVQVAKLANPRITPLDWLQLSLEYYQSEASKLSKLAS